MRSMPTGGRTIGTTWPSRPSNYHQFGGTIGGPIWMPKQLGRLSYDGRSRSFFFFNYEGIRFDSTTTALTRGADGAGAARRLQRDVHPHGKRCVRPRAVVRSGDDASESRRLGLRSRSARKPGDSGPASGSGGAAGAAVVSAAQSRSRKIRPGATTSSVRRDRQRHQPVHGAASTTR